MNSSQANFYKPNSSKIKLTNIYPYDSFRPGGINDFVNKGKSSLSPNKILTQKEFFNITRRNNSHQNNFSSYNYPYKYNDIDKLVEEITNLKLEMNKRNKEIHSLKIAFAKLDEENKKNLHIIEEVIIEANKHRRNTGESFKFDPKDLESEIRNCLTYSVTSDKLLAKLLESHAINTLKRQIFEYKNILATKDEELASFKANSRITKFQEVDVRLKNTIDELIHLKENYTILMNLLNEKESRLRENLEEKETYKSQNQKLKLQNEELKDRVLNYQEANSKMTDQIKFLEEKNSNFKYQISTFKTQLKEKEFEIARLKSDLSILETFKTEKEKYEKTLKNLNSNLTNLKEDLERKSNKLRELQRINYDIKQKSDKLEANKNNEPSSMNKKDDSKFISGRKDFDESGETNKDKKIIDLEKENVKLRKEIIKLNDDLIYKADNQLANIENEFKNKNTNDNLQSEINNLILENKKEELSNFEKNIEKELFTQDDLESENKFSDILNPLRIMDNKDKTSHRSYSSKNRLQAQININRKNNNIHKNTDNLRYDQEPEQNDSENDQINQLDDELKNRDFEKNNIESNRNEEILKNSLNNSLNKEENNFNYSDFKNKNDIEDENTKFNKEFKKDEKVNRIKRPENTKRKVSADNKEKLNQMLIDEENRNLNSSSENNLKNKFSDNEFDACDEYLREHDDYEKSDNDDYIYANKDAKVSEDHFHKNYNEELTNEVENMKTVNIENQNDLGEENYNEFEKCGIKAEEVDKNNENYVNFENDENNYGEFLYEREKIVN